MHPASSNMRGSSEFESKLRSGGAMSGAAAAIAGNGGLIGGTGVGGNTTGIGRTRTTRASAAAAAAAAAAGGKQGSSSTQNNTNNASNDHKPRTPPRGGGRGGGGGGQAMGKLSVGQGPDPELLRKALDDSVGEMEPGGATTPAPSPSRKRQRIYGDRYVWLQVGVWGRGIGGIDSKLIRMDRFIPNRDGVDLQASYSLLHAEGSPSTPTKPKKKVASGELQYQKGMYEMNFLSLGILPRLQTSVNY